MQASTRIGVVPRVNGGMLSSFNSQTVTLVGKVVSEDNGQATIMAAARSIQFPWIIHPNLPPFMF